jgi:hypothetical protein
MPEAGRDSAFYDCAPMMGAGISFDSTAPWDKLRRCVGNEIMTTFENKELRTKN